MLPRFSLLSLVLLLASLLPFSTSAEPSPVETESLMQVESTAEENDPTSAGDELLQQGFQQLYTSQLQTAVSSFQQAAEQYRKTGNRSGEAAALLGQAETYLWLGQYDQELRLAQQALEIYQSLNDRSGAAAAHHLIGDAYLNLDQLDQGMESLQKALAIRRELADRQGEGWTLGILGVGQIQQGELEAGLATLQQSLVILKEPVSADEQLQQQYRRGFILAWTGNAYRQLEDYDKADQYIQEALRLSQSIGNRAVEILSQFILGALLSSQEQFDQAMQTYQRALTLATETGSQSSEGWAFYRIAEIYKEQEQYSQAIAAFQQASQVFQNLNRRSQQADAIVQIGATYIEQSDYDQAITQYQQALKLYQKDENRQAEGETLNRIGVGYARQENYGAALEYYQQALVLHREVRNVDAEIQTLNNIARAYSVQEQYVEAIDNYRQALVIYRKNSDRYNEAETLYRLGGTYKNLKHYSQALQSYQQALEIYRSLAKTSDEAYALYQIGMLYFSQGENLRATTSYAESISFFEKAIEPLQQAQRIAQTLNNQELEHDVIQGLFLAPLNIGFSFGDQYQYSEQIVAYREALDTLQSYQGRFPENDLLTWKSQILMLAGLAYYNNTQYVETLPVFQESAQVATQISDFARQAESLQFMATAYESINEYVKSLEIRQQVLQIVREKSPDDKQAELFALILLGKAYGNLNQYSEEQKAYEQSIHLARELGYVHVEASSLNNIGVTYNYQGQYLRSLESLQQAWSINQTAIERLQAGDLQVIKQLCGESFTEGGLSGQQDCQEIYQTGKAQILSSVGSTYGDLGRYAEALNAHEQALENARQRNDRSSEALYLNNKSVVYLSLGDYAKATELLQQSLEIATAIDSRSMRSLLLGNLGYVYQSQGRYPEALEVYQQSLLLAREIGDWRFEATTLGNIGVVYSSQGKLEDALVSHQQAMEIRQKLGASIAVDLSNVGTVYSDQGKYLEALNAFEQALKIAESTGAREVEAYISANLADLYANQSDYAKAIELQQRGLQIRQEIGNRPGEINDLMNLGWLNLDLGQYEKAMTLFQQALALSQEVGSRPETAETLAGLAAVYREQRQYTQALEFYQQALKLSQEMGRIAYGSSLQKEIGAIYQLQGKSAEAVERLTEALKTQQAIGVRPEVGSTLNHLGLAYADQGNTVAAINALQQAIAIHRDVGDRAAEAEALANLGQVFAQQNQPEVAIAFYKQSINLTEQIRQGLQTLSRDQQESYTDTVTNRYRTLADLLIAQKRLLEAEQVIELLRLQEVYEYSRSTVSASGEVTFTPAEQEIQTRYDSLIAFAKIFAECNAQANCNDDIYRQRTQLNQEWNAAIDELNAAAAARQQQTDDELAPRLRSVSSLGSTIVEAQPHTVMIYPVVQDNRLSILWFMPGGISNAIQVEVDQKEIAIAVSQFRELMKGCEVRGCTSAADVEAIQAVSQRLYGWLMPSQLQTELKQNNIKNLVFALDRFLRYIPMSALYDGEQYLIETYSISTVTATPSNHNNPLPASNQISVLGLGLSDSVPADPNRGIPQPFSPLDNVRTELAAIVEDEQTSGRSSNQGIFRGRELLNSAFDRSALWLATQYQILHIATHGSFDPINESNSFLVLGTKEALTIPEIENYGVAAFGKLSLVVLSACETALGEAERYRDGVIPDGREVTSIAQTFIDARVDTIVASLWQVNDPATAVLMHQFYANLAANSAEHPVTIAQALQTAQLSLLHGQTATGSLTTRSDVIPGGVALSPTSEAATTRYAHPYYWSAFTIIGDGL